jgi:hypothetical protein
VGSPVDPALALAFPHTSPAADLPKPESPPSPSRTAPTSGLDPTSRAPLLGCFNQRRSLDSSLEPLQAVRGEADGEGAPCVEAGNGARADARDEWRWEGRRQAKRSKSRSGTGEQDGRSDIRQGKLTEQMRAELQGRWLVAGDEDGEAS